MTTDYCTAGNAAATAAAGVPLQNRPLESLPRPTVYWQKSAPAAVRAGRIFTGKLSAGGDFFERGRSSNGDPFMGPANIIIRGRHIKFVIIFSWADFSRGRHFNVTSAPDNLLLT